MPSSPAANTVSPSATPASDVIEEQLRYTTLLFLSNENVSLFFFVVFGVVERVG